MNVTDLKKIEEDLIKKESMMGEVGSWWSNVASLKISELNYLQEKLQEKWDDQLAARFEKIQTDLKYLFMKSEFEQREINKFEKNRAGQECFA